MKKIYRKSKILALMVGLFTMKMSAQLSGVVTINNTLPASATNYTSFTAFASDINSVGVSGALTVNVAAGSGPYVEQVNFNAITGTTASSVVTINGNGCTITFSASSSTLVYTFMLSGADFFKVNNLNIVGTGASYGLPLHLWNASDNNSFNSCTVTVNANVSTAALVPLSVSGSSTSATTAGSVRGGSDNEFVNCHINNGASGCAFYSTTSAPFASGNKLINCTILDSYTQGVVLSNVTDQVVRGCVIERPTRTTFPTTSYGMTIAGTLQRVMVENNYIRNAFSSSSATGNYYGFNLSGSGTSGNEVVIRNNIISDLKGTGTQIGMYSSGSANYILIHNTISLDDAAATSGSTYGFQLTTGPFVVKNNIVTVSRGGTGTKYCAYYSGTMGTNFKCDNNVLFMNSAAGSNYVGYVNTNMATLALMQAQGVEMSSINTDPLYAIPGTNYAPTALAVNNLGTAMGVATDINGATRSVPSPDPGAIEIFNATCFGNPGTSTVTAPSFTYCSNTPVSISFAASVYSNSGISYQWVSSTTSALGPFTPVNGATLTSMITPTTANITTYYSAQVMCAGGGTTTIQAGTVFMHPTAISSVPYYESFEVLNQQNLLPNCSWAVSNTVTALTQTVMNTNGRIPRTGANFGMFVNSPTGANYFYTNGIQLDAGVTYSASLWWLTESVGYTNWTDLSILIGSNQSPTGQTIVATTNGPAVSPVHKLLTGNFTVPTSGIYYLAVRGTAASGSATYLSFDDIRVGIPCSLNSPSVTLNTLSSTVCSDKPVTIFASGADTYTWSTGDNSAAITVTPGLATTGYTLAATRLLSGCTATFAQNLTVNPSPIVFAASSEKEVCSGRPVVLSALGQNITAYSWSDGSNMASTIVYPTITTTYSVIVVNGYGCSSMATKEITVNPLPALNIAAPTVICRGEQVSLTGSIGGGAATYSWVSNTSIMYTGNPLVLAPQSSAVFTVTAENDKHCAAKKTYTLAVDACTGLNKATAAAAGITIYPNPSNGVFTLETATSNGQLEVMDVTGRTILKAVIGEERTRIDLNDFANGVYYVKVRSGNSLETIKVIKNK